MVASSNELITRWVTHKELAQSAISTAVRKVDSWVVYFPKNPEERGLCVWYPMDTRSVVAITIEIPCITDSQPSWWRNEHEG